MVTHDQEEALSLADLVIVMNKGRIEQTGSPEELYNGSGCRFGSGFLGHMNILTSGGIRYEDVIVLRPTEQSLRAPDTHIAKVTHCALMGAYYRLELLLNDFSTRVVADVPRASDREILRQDAIVAVRLPADRLHSLEEECA